MRLQDQAGRRRHAGLGQPRHAAGGRRKPARRVVPRDDRQGIRVEVVGVLVRQHDQVGADLVGRDRRQRQPLEPVQPLHRVGQVRVEIDDPAGRGLEGKSRLAQPPESERVLRHDHFNLRETHTALSFPRENQLRRMGYRPNSAAASAMARMFSGGTPY